MRTHIQQLIIYFLFQLAALTERFQRLQAEHDYLSGRCGVLSVENEHLKQEVKRLEQQLAVNSRNSHKPPSSDGPRHKRYAGHTRKPSGKKPGGQKHHPGHTLKPAEQPDHIQPIPVVSCEHCHGSLLDQPVKTCQTRQVFDLPPIKLEVTEYRAEVKDCPHCGQTTAAAFPDHASQPVQYGSRLKSLGIYLMDYQLLPYDRTAQLLEDITGQPVSCGTLFTTREQCAENLIPFEAVAKDRVTGADVTHFDETGVWVMGKNHWLHVACTGDVTFYAIHPKRGQKAMDDIGVLPDFKGKAVHDSLASYFKYDCQHNLCNAHHKRELEWAIEQEQADWAQQTLDCLLDIKKTVELAKAAGLNRLDQQTLDRFEARYDHIIEQAYEQWVPANAPPPAPTGKRGRKKQSKAKNLLDRLKKNKDGVLGFMRAFNVPFDNNMAERDLRMIKLKLKISGTFRTEHGAKTFCRIRGYISTAKKQDWNILDAIEMAILNTPFMPA